MNIGIIGVNGFIGKSLYFSFCQQSYQLTGFSRKKIPGINWRELDFSQSVDSWLNQLKHLDVVINASGIYKETRDNRFSDVHTTGPVKLFEACIKLNIRVIQISAIGAEKEVPTTEFLQSKRIADQYLLCSNTSQVVLYPGIVLGEGGASTKQLCLLARLRVIPVISAFRQPLPVISIYQLVEFINQILFNWPEKSISSVLLSKPEKLQYTLENLRRWMGLNNKWFLKIYLPDWLLSFIFLILPNLSIGLFNKQSMNMLSDYQSSGSSKKYNKYIKYETDESLPASQSLAKFNASDDFIKDGKLKILSCFNVLSLSLIWCGSGISSLINMKISRELVEMLGINQGYSDPLIITAAIADIILGLLIWVKRYRRIIVYVQIAFMLVYSFLITLFLPVFWLHPFAPVLKNISMFVLAMYLLVDEGKG